MYEKWKEQRKTDKEEKKYKPFKPSTSSPFHPDNRKKMMNILRRQKFTNFYKIINIKQAKTDRLFMDAKRAFKRAPNKETFNRGFFSLKDF